MPDTDDSRTSRCRGCGAQIVWGADTGGGQAYIPLDPRPAVYQVVTAGNPPRPVPASSGGIEVQRCDRALIMVSHFATCPKATQFSRAKKGGEEGDK